MKGLEPTLLEKLFDDDPRTSALPAWSGALTLEQMKETVARDLEGLLNTRAAYDVQSLAAFPECQHSLMTYGLDDFSAMSLANGQDRARICRSLEGAIARHERRLRAVQVSLESNSLPGGGLHFTIHAVLDVSPTREPVSFDATLQPSTLQYQVSRLRRQAA
ncbi:type VI secretion system baseplate subunit TssE [Xanthomonas massiliensis]|uniref:type VI secretion system baseplate subunit TssE n=1 Tax=Xanthomonas massiliensis TaxID=1720302 RepID=UPI0008241583|nr:type VI secretion system baseplate subunit TssE [Xanthomonas massiliensis]